MTRQAFDSFSKEVERCAEAYVDWVKRKRDIIKIRLGDDAEDYPEFIRDTLFGEVDDISIERHRNGLLGGIVHHGGAVDFNKKMAAYYAEKAKKEEERVQLLKELLIETLELFGEDKWSSKLEMGTVYSQQAKDKIEVVDPLLLPPQYLKAPEPASSKITADIKAGKTIPGVEVIPGETRPRVWTVRPSRALKEAEEV